MWKNLLLLLFVSLVPVCGLPAQDEADDKRYERIRLARQAVITEQLELSAEEASAFFPIYWDFQEQLDQTRKSVVRGRRRATADRNFTDMTESEAKAAIVKLQENRKQILALSVEAENRYLTVLPAKKVLQLELAERAFRKKLWERMGRERRHK